MTTRDLRRLCADAGLIIVQRIPNGVVVKAHRDTNGRLRALEAHSHLRFRSAADGTIGNTIIEIEDQ